MSQRSSESFVKYTIVITIVKEIMKISQLFLHIILIFVCYFFLVLINSRAEDFIPMNISIGSLGDETAPIPSNQNNNEYSIKLIQPDSASQITTFAPKFIWHALKSNRPIEYRLLIAKIDGKIIFDQWIGPDTSYAFASSNAFEDLNPYYWTIYAAVGDHQVQSPVWSFWIDQDVVTDLSVSNIQIEQEKGNWNPGDEVKIRAMIHNSGPIHARGCFVTLFSGNTNQNYFNYAALRKSIALDTVFLSELKMTEPRSITLNARLPYGFNHFFVRIDPSPGLKDIIHVNNYIKGIKIQTEDRFLALKGLFIIYKNYLDPEAGELRLDQTALDTLSQNILNFQRYFWDHTQIVQIDVDTLHQNRLITDNEFSYQDDEWGYFLPPTLVSTDLKKRNMTEFNYDFVFVYYSWWNSSSSWSGYSGYAFKEHKFINTKLPFLAQPVISGQIEEEETIIHEFLHLLDHLFEESGEKQFYSPHHRSLYTTFEKNMDYYEWMLETWPTDKWFNLGRGHIFNRTHVRWPLEPTTIFAEQKQLILSPNYPNPFNQITTIIYKIPQYLSSTNTVKVSLVIYDIAGNRIRTLVNAVQKPGTYRVYWNGKDQKGEKISSGIYFYELKAGNQRQIKKLLFIR